MARDQQVPRRRRPLRALTALVLGAVACGSSSPPAPGVPTDAGPVVLDLGARDGRAVFAMSDVHGGYDRMVGLLVAGRLAPSVPASPSGIRWSGGTSVLVVVGDLVDKGPQPLEVIDALRALEGEAEKAGGRVVVLLGNHEAELFADPTNDKATADDGIDAALDHIGLAPTDFAAGVEPRGAWLRLRPFGARVGGAFFAHGGSTRGATLEELTALLGPARARSFAEEAITGADSILEARAWWADGAAVLASTRALGVSRIVFGHDPKALGDRGRIGVSDGARAVRVDCGMSPDVNDSTGCLLRIGDEGASEVGQEILADGAVRELWRVPR